MAWRAEMIHQLLFSSRDLDVIPGDPLFHNPVHLSGRWYWLVDLTFGAWALRVSARARAANDFSRADSENLDRIIAHLTSVHGLPAVAALEARISTPVALPPIPAPIFNLNHFGPSWATYEQDAAKYRPQLPDPALATPDVMARQPPPAPPAPPAQPRSSYRTKPAAVANSSLFGVSS